MHKKIAILGGSYNPITKGHIAIAKIVIDKTDIEQVWMSPCFGHRLKEGLVDSSLRLEMCRLALKFYPNIKCWDYEVSHCLDGSVFDFLNILKSDPEMKNYDFSYIIGMDNVNIFDQWKNHEQLKAMIRFIVVPRDGVEVIKTIDWYEKPPHIYLDENIMNVSATEIRRLLKLWWNNTLSVSDEDSLSRKVPKIVMEYIEGKNLYKE